MVSKAKQPLIVVVGPTASGKSDLAIAIAKKYKGEIICADSRTVYKEFNIGTAKPSILQRRLVPHHLLDIVSPKEIFTAADFQKIANQKIREINSRGHVAILAGGTGLYVDGVLFDYTFGPEANIKKRQQYEEMTLEQLHKYCHKNNIELPENTNNKRYVIRAIEQKGVNKSRSNNLRQDTLVVGIATDNQLRHRIKTRADQMFDDGIVDEARRLVDKYGPNSAPMKGNIYQLALQHLRGDINLDEMKQKFVTLDWRLAKRQITWLKRNHYIRWGDRDAIMNVVDEFMAQYSE